jgi:CRP-like cAMP-binding protein
VVSGQIRYSFTSANGKDAIICVFSDGGFFGERCLTSHSRFFGTASALTDSVALRLSCEEARTQSQLAEMVGTTRSRVNTFMNKFRQLGFVTYTEDEIVVKPNLTNILKTDPR